ncbi:hypothetical protein WR25_11677 [Diploscapter pachys]|uniref:Uncharacterized protein n=1 Tax=Diploscapter pachys TaxID=2018661 RepID=A0A2A2LB64_9BILA|nr:hypothetical protein WR25_11677 [Diploscapter pachys]
MNCFQAKKGLSDDVKDIQVKALQTGPNADTMLASFFNESDLEKCVEELRFLQNPRAGQPTGKCAQNATSRESVLTKSATKMEKLMNHSDMNQGKRKKKRNILDLRTGWREWKKRRLANSNVVSKRVESLTIVRREAIVRTIIQALDDNSSQTDNQQRAADIDYNSCYLQSKMLNSYNHKAAQSYVVFI